MEPLDPRTQARVQATVQEYRASFVTKPKSTPAPKISPPRIIARKVAQSPRAEVQAILAAVCEAWDIPLGDLLSRWRPHRVSYPRFAAIRLMRRMTDLSYPAIGKIFDKDHTSVMAGMRRSHELIHEDSAWRACYRRAEAALQTEAVGRPLGGDTGTASGQRQGQVPAKPISAAIVSPPLAGGRAPGASSPTSPRRTDGGAP